MTPGTFLTVFVAGLIAAWLAASLMKDGGYGLVWDIALALPGSALAYWIVQPPGTSPDGGMVPPTAVALVGAAGPLGAQRQFWPGAPLKSGRPPPRAGPAPDPPPPRPPRRPA